MTKKIIFEADDKEFMSITVDWIAKMYHKMNNELFLGSLGGCDFDVFTSGRGSQGGTLGFFCLTGSGVKCNLRSRKLLVPGTYVDSNNFVELCRPVIKLNGNYKWTEKSAISTLVHEMCHYYTYMNGYAPKQPHGKEFRDIALMVSLKSNGFFTVQRLASAEQMSEMELDNELKQKKINRIDNKISRMTPVLVFKKNGEIRLINCSNAFVVDKVVATETLKTRIEGLKEIKICNDIDFKKWLFSNGYDSVMLTYRFWSVENDDKLMDTLKHYPMETLYKSEDTGQDITDNTKENIIRHYRFMTTKGDIFDIRNVTKEQLKQSLKDKFPNFTDDIIEKLVNNEKYYIS